MGTAEQVIIRELEGKLDRLKTFYCAQLGKYRNIDLRASAIASVGNTLRSELFFYSMAEYTITRVDWWKSAYGREGPTANEQAALGNLNKLGKLSFFVFFLSSIEWTIRKLICHIWPGQCKSGKADFKPSYDFVLKQLGLLRYQPLYDLCRHVRNTIHSGGIYISRSGKDQTVSWKTNSFNFVYTKPIDFMSHELILGLYDDLIQSLQDVMSNGQIENAAFASDDML